jgi:hypothetical protein
MIHTYINYPDTRMTKHRDSGCPNIQESNKPDQRISRITLESLSSELAKFASKEYTFASDLGHNDIWVEIDLGDIQLETAVADYVLKLVAEHYSPMRGVKPTTHC